MLNENCFSDINWILNDWVMMDDLQTTFFAFMCGFFACWNFGIFIIYFLIEARCFYSFTHNFSDTFCIVGFSVLTMSTAV